MGPSIKHILGVLELFYMLTEKILLQNRGFAFLLSSGPPLPLPVWQKTRLFTGFFPVPFTNDNQLLFIESNKFFLYQLRTYSVGGCERETFDSTSPLIFQIFPKQE